MDYRAADWKYIQYLSPKYLINKALWSQWFEAASVPSTEEVLVKLFNIQLRRSKTCFVITVCFSYDDPFSFKKGALYYDVQMK